METAEYARTSTATAKHIVKPDDHWSTLCGASVRLHEHYMGDDGQMKTAHPMAVRAFPLCKRCERSAAKRGMTLA